MEVNCDRHQMNNYLSLAKQVDRKICISLQCVRNHKKEDVTCLNLVKLNLLLMLQSNLIKKQIESLTPNFDF
jgi:hypothetical protein